MSHEIWVMGGKLSCGSTEKTTFTKSLFFEERIDGPFEKVPFILEMTEITHTTVALLDFCDPFVGYCFTADK